MLDGLTAENSRELEDILLQLLVKAEAESVFLCDQAGNIWASRALNKSSQEDNVAALCSASFFATREIARLVGEPEFNRVLHQGENKGIFMQNTGSDHLVVVVFGRQTNAGLVKLFTGELMSAIEDCLRQSGEEPLADELRDKPLAIDSDGPVFQVSDPPS